MLKLATEAGAAAEEVAVTIPEVATLPAEVTSRFLGKTMRENCHLPYTWHFLLVGSRRLRDPTRRKCHVCIWQMAIFPHGFFQES